MKFQGSTCLITGGASGIGLALAQRFLDRGSRVIVCGRRADVLEQHPQFESLVCDLEKPEERERLAKLVVEKFPELNVLVNNAGVQRRVDLKAGVESWGDWRSEIAINLEAPIHLTGLLVPHLVGQKNATVVNVSSGLSFAPLANVPVYCATKAGLHSFTMSLRHQLADTGVKVVEVIPPAVDTDLGGPGLHTFGANVEKFANAMMAGLASGEHEIGYGTSERARRSSRDELDAIFHQMNPLAPGIAKDYGKRRTS